VSNKSLLIAALSAVLLSGCAALDSGPKSAAAVRINEDPFPSTYARYPGVLTVIRHATVFTGDGQQINDGTVVFADGVIKAVGGPELASPAGALEIDGTGKFVTPGIIDIHSHLGDYPSPGVSANSDGNEATDPVRPEVWAEHSVWPQDPGFSRALVNGGVTTLQILPGSANLFGGRSVVLKNVPGRTVQEMKFPGAPYGLKMACGENPKRVYGAHDKMPQTRMGNIALARETWAKALGDGIRAGIPNLSEAVAWEWLSRNPAKALGILDKTGTLTPGKMADVVLWNGDPFSDYSRPERVWIDGAEMYDANNPKKRPVSDFELGQPGEGDVK
jgi:imidazolonepropionase-like amidohydrolase